MTENNKCEHGLTHRSRPMVSLLDGLTYLLIGGGIGAAVALLFAPKSGNELRGDIADISRRGYDETLERAQQLRDQSAEIYQAVKDKADEVYDFAAGKLSSGKEEITAAVENAAGSVADAADSTIAEATKVLKHSG